MKTTPLLLAALLLTTACIEDPDPMTDPAASDAREADGATDAGPDPEYRRACMPGDYDCTIDECNGAGTDGPLGCFKRCAPASLEAAGERHPDCDEPERPFCSEVGLWMGGDYACNDCVYLCTAEPQGTRCHGQPMTCG